MEIRSDIKCALQSTDEETRREALKALRGQPLIVVRELLVSAMGDNSWRVRKDAVDVFVAADPDDCSIRELLEQLRNEDNAGLRNSAAEAITRLGSRSSAPLFCLAGDADADVRKFVLDVMGSIGSPEFLPALRGALGDRDVNVAAAAAEHLGNLGDSATVPDLLDAIIANESDFFRFSALAALGKMTSHVHIPDDILTLADQDILRKGVYDCLGSIGDDKAAPILLKGFLSRQKSSRKAALLSWYRIFLRSSATARRGMEDSLHILSGPEIVSTLIDSFDLHESSLAEAITALLGIIGDIRGIPTLLTAFACERLTGAALTSLKRFGSDGIDALVELFPLAEDSARGSICTLLGEVSNHAGDAVIRSALHDKSLLVRKTAVSAAGKLGLSNCIPDIAELLNDNDLDLRIVVISSLQALALIDRNAVQIVARRLGESDRPELRRNAAILHAALGDAERLSLLVKDEDAGVRQAAVSSIGKLPLYENSGVLLIALVDEDPDVRIAAVEALGNVGGHDIVDALLYALNDEDIWVQSAVLRSIARIDLLSVLPAIKSVFSQAEGLLMITCLELLESIGTAEAMDLVEAALASRDKDVMSLAISILTRQGGEWIITHSGRLLMHPSEDFRLAWAGVLAELPRKQAEYFLSLALEREENIQVKAVIKNLMEGSA